MKFYDINGLEKGNLATEEWATYELQNPDTTRFSNYKARISINKSIGLCSIYFVVTFASGVTVDSEKVIAIPNELKTILNEGLIFNCGYAVVGHERDFIKLRIYKGFIESYVAGPSKHYDYIQSSVMFNINNIAPL